MTVLFPIRALGVLLCSALLAACAAQTPGPSVPYQRGASLASARAAFQSCLGPAQQSGQNTMAGHYIGSVLWGGVVVGPIFVASNAPALRYNGEVSGMDRCMKKRGFTRRDLTPQEMQALEAADPVTRRAMLDHLVAGGTLDTLPRG
ncbi:hypothetical protein [Sagittula sp.]|uniref:hypothetical protein n=1 Tax=Sagittula sp. TaxID=2038081 RepID=UPI0035152E39